MQEPQAARSTLPAVANSMKAAEKWEVVAPSIVYRPIGISNRRIITLATTELSSRSVLLRFFGMASGVSATFNMISPVG